MLIPLYGFVEGDTIGLLVLSHHDMSIEAVAEKLRGSARLRVDSDRAAELRFEGRALSPERTVAECGLRALDRVDLRFVGDGA
jgi:hypothetical protein